MGVKKDKFYGPKSRDRAIKLIKDGEKLLAAAKAFFEALEVQEPGSDDYAASMMKSALYEMLKRSGELFTKAGSTVYLNNIDEPDEVPDLMRKAIEAKEVADVA